MQSGTKYCRLPTPQSSFEACRTTPHNLTHKGIGVCEPDVKRHLSQDRMQAVGHTQFLAEQLLTDALSSLPRQAPTVASAEAPDLQYKLMQVLDTQSMFSATDKKLLLVEFLRLYANPLPAKHLALSPRILCEAVLQSGQSFFS